jgi:hypothetical protein
MEQIKKIIDKHADLFKKPNVISVEPGYLFKNGWITSTPAIVVSVRRKLRASVLLDHELLPLSVEGVLVDVVIADPIEQVESTGIDIASLRIANFVSESFVSQYKTLPGNPINTVFSINEQILCHASPDAGWPVLKQFIAEVNNHLTVAMYDFNAGYIAKSLIDTSTTTKADIDLILDDDVLPAEQEIQDKMDTELKDKFRRTIASTGNSGLFASAYHEKVMVRDHRSFWLSSGNWSLHSLPEPDGQPDGDIFQGNNRDWHVIVHDETLAKLFEQYIYYDIDESKKRPATPKKTNPEFFISQRAILDLKELHKASSIATPQLLPTKDNLPLKIQPLLTPDNYIDHILDLVRNCKRSFYLQLQYMRISDQPSDEKFRELTNLVCAITNNANIDSKIIIGQRDSQTAIRKYKEKGFDIDKVRVQPGVHNKGIIVDNEIVVVGSHNWSGDGTLRNRDASLIIYDKDITAYYKDIFIDDWKNRSFNNVFENLSPVLATPGEPTPAGSIRVPWSAIYE